jgi:nucleotide-binding universal stress UspA family protein
MGRETLVVPVVFPDPELHPLHTSLVKELENFEILLLGYWEVPAGDDPDEIRDAHQTEAEGILYEIAAEFSKEGAPVDIQLHFGPSGDEERNLRERVAEQTHAAGVLLINNQTLLRRGLVAVGDAHDGSRLLNVIRQLDPETTLQLELYHAAESQEEATAAEDMLRDMLDQLHEAGFSYVDLTETVEVTDNPEVGIIRQARDHEFIMMGETEEPDIKDEIFGETYEYIAEKTELPILLGLAEEG